MCDIRFFCEDAEDRYESKGLPHFVAPGDAISADPSFMRGRGTYVEDGKIYSCVAGIVERVSKLYSVRPIQSRYEGEVGDVVVGRIVDIQDKKWVVDVNARLDAVLGLSSVNLPGGQHRRKTREDELKMRNYLREGDLISAEVHSIFQDGCLRLHTRSLKYGKLGQGVLVKVPPSLVERKKIHFHEIVSGVQLILSNNGYIWIAPAVPEGIETGGHAQDLEPVSKIDREAIVRLKNCICALVHHHRHLISDTVALYAYEASMNYPAKDILLPEVMKEIADCVTERINLEQP